MRSATAKGWADMHAGVIAWSREAHPDVGDYGPTTTLFVSGDVSDMEYRPYMEKLAFLLAFAICFGIGGALVWLIVR